MRTVVLVALAALGGVGGVLRADGPGPPDPPENAPAAATGGGDTPRAAAAFDRLLTTWLADVVPTVHQDDSKWGLTASRVRGLTWDFDGGKIETRRRYGVVNHGLWQRWSIERPAPGPPRPAPPAPATSPGDPAAVPAPDPPGRSLRVSLDEVRLGEDGRYDVTATVAADVIARGQVARWVEGVQWGAFSAEASLTLTATVRLSAAVSVDLTTFPPAASIAPTVVETRLALSNWRVRRFSRLGRDVAEVVGDWLESAVRSWVEDQGPRVTEKLNKALAKRQDRLRWGEPGKTPPGRDAHPTPGGALNP